MKYINYKRKTLRMQSIIKLFISVYKFLYIYIYIYIIDIKYYK